MTLSPLPTNFSGQLPLNAVRPATHHFYSELSYGWISVTIIFFQVVQDLRLWEADMESKSNSIELWVDKC